MIDRIIGGQVVDSLKKFPVVCIIGPRQVGKTTLAKHIAKNSLKKKWLYLDLELHDDISRLTDPSAFLQAHEDHCVIIDEVQRQKNLFPLMRALVDKHRIPGRFILLGSATPELIHDSTESLAGRISYKELAPFNITEVEKKSAMEIHWLKGGFPLAYLDRNNNTRFEWTENFIRTYIERDLPMLGSPANPILMRKMLQMLSHLHGQVWNASYISKSLEITAPTVRTYLSFLENSFLINMLQPYHFNIKKRLVKAPKIYFRDSGILHYLHGLQTKIQLFSNPLLGHSWEGYVIEQIKQLAGTQNEMFFYRTHRGTECDLVITRNGKPVAAIEIKFTSAPKISEGLKISIEDLRTPKNYIIIPTENDYSIQKEIRVCDLKTFLKKYLSNL